MSKNCSRCKIELVDGVNFRSVRIKKKGYFCNDCHNAANKKEQDKLKDDVIAGYGGKCACCGVSERSFLTIDHIFNDGGKERKDKTLKQSFYRRLRRENYPTDRYMLLCMNCNRGKYLNGGFKCPHQTKIK